jgi:hypothetical protein
VIVRVALYDPATKPVGFTFNAILSGAVQFSDAWPSTSSHDWFEAIVPVSGLPTPPPIESGITATVVEPVGNTGLQEVGNTVIVWSGVFPSGLTVHPTIAL